MSENVVYQISTSPLMLSEVVEILSNPEKENVLVLPPVKPKGGEVFLLLSLKEVSS